MRLVMLGTGPYAVPTLTALATSRHELVAVVTRPSRQQRRSSESPVSAAAQAAGLRVCAPESVNRPPGRQLLAEFEPELLVVCDYGEILKPATLQLAPRGGINLHASLLPRYRGAAPVQWALFHGERETGNSVIHMTPQLDAGPCLWQQRVNIDPNETAVELEARLATLGATGVLQVIEDLAAGTAQPVPQNSQQSTRAPRLRKSDSRVDWSRTAQQLHDQIRAWQPWPRCDTYWRSRRLILDRARLATGPRPAEPGVVQLQDQRLFVGTGSGTLELLRLQPAGKKILSADAFLRGYPVRDGDRLGAAE